MIWKTTSNLYTRKGSCTCLLHTGFNVFVTLLLFKSRFSLIILANVVLNRTVVVDSDWRFLWGSHLQSQSELYHVSWWYYTLVIDLIGQLCRDVTGRLSVKPWCYWLWRLVISNWCVSIRLLSQLNSRSCFYTNPGMPHYNEPQKDKKNKLKGEFPTLTPFCEEKSVLKQLILITIFAFRWGLHVNPAAL